jgi:hypothetical protein
MTPATDRGFLLARNHAAREQPPVPLNHNTTGAGRNPAPVVPMLRRSVQAASSC